jgi:outer membrane protein OmpA-like peptidoglycan-associated protein
MTDTPGKVRWTNQEQVMNRAVLFPLMAGLAWGNCASAYESNYLNAVHDVEQWQGGHFNEQETAPTYSEEWQGAGIGGIAGAILAGPPGFIIGAAGGVLAGRNSGLESDLHTTRQEVARLQQQRKQDVAQLAELSQQLRTAHSHNKQQLQAIASGFIYRIQFRTNQSALELQDQQALKALAQALGTLQSLRVHVQAFADKRGRTSNNQTLTEARALSVTDQLVQWGVPFKRIETQAYGEANAQYDPSDVEGLGYDRQVIIRFCYQEAT